MTTEVVLITGASSGLGLELAQLFAAERSNLVLVARREQQLQTLAEQLRSQHNVDVRVLARDLSQPAAPQEIFDELTRQGIQIDVLVNNAGFGTRGPVAQLDVQRQLDMVQLNVKALTQLTLLFLPGMLARNQGGILNVASTAAFQPGPNVTVYYATKAFVLSFTEGLAEELRHTPLRITCFCPGPTHTGFAAVADMEKTSLFKFGAMRADVVARTGYKGFRKGKTLVVPGFKNKLGTFMVRLVPRVVVRKFLKFIQS